MKKILNFAKEAAKNPYVQNCAAVVVGTFIGRGLANRSNKKAAAKKSK